MHALPLQCLPPMQGKEWQQRSITTRMQQQRQHQLPQQASKSTVPNPHAPRITDSVLRHSHPPFLQHSRVLRSCQQGLTMTMILACCLHPRR